MWIDFYIWWILTKRKINQWLSKFKQPNIQLRDAYTGQPLGMTKKQYKRYVATLGSKNHLHITQACEEIKQRKAKLNYNA